MVEIYLIFLQAVAIILIIITYPLAMCNIKFYRLDNTVCIAIKTGRCYYLVVIILVVCGDHLVVVYTELLEACMLPRKIATVHVLSLNLTFS